MSDDENYNAREENNNAAAGNSISNGECRKEWTEDCLLAHSTPCLSISSLYTSSGGGKSTLRHSLLSTEMCCPHNQGELATNAAVQRSYVKLHSL